MALSNQQLRQVCKAARQIPLDAASEKIEDFIGRVLALNPFQLAQMFPSPDPAGSLALATAGVTKERETILRDACSIPTFAVYNDAAGAPTISGFRTYLRTRQLDPTFLGRLAHYSSIRTVLQRITRGHDLEAIAAAIMNERCGYGEATRGSGDQGIDAVGWMELILIEPSFSDGAVEIIDHLPGAKVFLFASSKALMSSTAHSSMPKLINPAHIRELVGGWIIQRSTTGKWQGLGIKMLSPVQMVLVTTYRLSPEAKAECRTLGVQVWGMPELIYLVCLSAPAQVFDAQNNFLFSANAFRVWWQQRNPTRLRAA